MGTVSIDLALIVQAVMVIVLTGVGGLVWHTALAIARLMESFRGHENLDNERHKAILLILATSGVLDTERHSAVLRQVAHDVPT